MTKRKIATAFAVVLTTAYLCVSTSGVASADDMGGTDVGVTEGGEAVGSGGQPAIPEEPVSPEPTDPHGGLKATLTTESLDAECDYVVLIGYWCGKMKNNAPTSSLMVVHNWYADSRVSWNGYLNPGRTTQGYNLYWADTDGFYVPYPYSVKVQYGGTYKWYPWYGCYYNPNGYCKVGFYKIANTAPDSWKYYLGRVAVY